MKLKILLILIPCHYFFSTCSAQIDTILWQDCFGTDDGYNHVTTVEKHLNSYLFGILLVKDGPGVTNFHGKSDAWIIQTDKSGNINWERCYGGTNGDGPEKIIKISERSYYLLNYTGSSDGDVQNGRGGNFWVVKIDDLGNIIWENSYGGTPNGEEVRDAILMPDHGLLMMGRITSSGGDVSTFYGQTDIWFCRIDSTGLIKWEKTFGNMGMDNALKIKLTSHNTIMMIGGHPEPGGMIDCPYHWGPTWGCDVWIIEMDIKGNLLNQWCYGGSKDDLGWDIVEIDSGYVFAALTNSLDGDVSGFHGYEWTESYDFWIVKIDLNGNIVWQKCLGGTSMENPSYLTNTNDGGLIIIGEAQSFDGDVTWNHSLYDFYSDIWVVKLSSEGQLEWNHCFGGEGTERFFLGLHSVLKLENYNYIIGADANYLDQDVQCDLFPNDLQNNAWIFEIKDCDYYFPGIPYITSGPDTLCTTSHPTSNYTLNQVQWAEGYDWLIEPDSAGSLVNDSTSILITWNPQFEGLVTITARSYNDCGSSGGSEPKLTMVYPCLGMDEQGSGEAGKPGRLVVWPNPTKEIVNCQLSTVNCQSQSSTFNLQPTLIIYDIFGRIALSLLRQPAERAGDGGWNWQIDVSTLPPGIYLTVVRDEKAVIGSAKFAVARH